MAHRSFREACCNNIILERKCEKDGFQHYRVRTLSTVIISAPISTCMQYISIRTGVALIRTRLEKIISMATWRVIRV